MGKKTAVVLFNLGGPRSEEEIYPFLFSLFYDKSIISLPNPFRYFLAKIIAKTRLPKATDIYSQLGGGSPLFRNTLHQAAALQEELGGGHRVFVAMRHAPPFTFDTFQKVKAYRPNEVVLLPLYPHYSTTTTGSSFLEWERIVRKEKWRVPTRRINAYPTHEGFLAALHDLMGPAFEKSHTYGHPQVLLTAHGLPEKTIKRGDPYQGHVEDTVKALAIKDSVLCYQSRVGPLKWIGPSLEEEIIKASQNGRPLVVVPISFVSEHSETLVELDITLRHLALQNGCPSYLRVPTVQTHPTFIKGLASLVKLAPSDNM